MTAPVPAYDPSNIFAKIIRGEMPSHKVFEDVGTCAFMDIMPRADGHCLVVPRSSTRTLLDASPTDLAMCMTTVQRISQAAMIAFGADGITLQQFNESAGGQVVFHLHFHILPRHHGVALKPHTGKMENPDVLAANAAKLRAALAGS